MKKHWQFALRAGLALACLGGLSACNTIVSLYLLQAPNGAVFSPQTSPTPSPSPQTGAFSG